MSFKLYFRKSSFKKDLNSAKILLQEIENYAPKSFLEIGVFQGVTSRNVCEKLNIIHEGKFKYIGIDLFEDTDETIELSNGDPIAESCEEAGVPFACTEGVCGTCVIEVTEGMGNLSEFTQEEEDFLGELDNERLACQCKIQNGQVKVKF